MVLNRSVDPTDVCSCFFCDSAGSPEGCCADLNIAGPCLVIVSGWGFCGL